MRYRYIICVLLTLLLCDGCATRKAEVTTTLPSEGNTWAINRNEPKAFVPSVIIYKTRGDYNNLVPVTMDITHSHIVSYPDPADLRRYDGALRLPTPLNNGYLLDNKGINAQTAFIDYTYEEYVALDTIPSLDQFMQHIVDKHPFVEMWDCGKTTKYRDLIVDINHLIDSNLPGCRNIIYKY